MNNKYIMSFVFPSHSTNLRIYRNNLLRYNNKFKSYFFFFIFAISIVFSYF